MINAFEQQTMVRILTLPYLIKISCDIEMEKASEIEYLIACTEFYKITIYFTYLWTVIQTSTITDCCGSYVYEPTLPIK